MERKFKVGDKVRTRLGRDAVVVYVLEFNGESDPYVVKYDDSSIGTKPESDLTLIPPKKLPDPKFNPYDKVRVNIKGFTPFDAEVTSWFICGDHYLYELKTDDGGTIQSKGEGVELINPRYKPGDKVWNKVTSNIWEFVEYNEYKGGVECVILFNETKCVVSLSGIEPYTGQDKVVVEPEKPTHPYTVILKSGVKIGISSTMFDYINEQDNNTASVQTVEDGSFILSEIAAIAPTENLIP